MSLLPRSLFSRIVLVLLGGLVVAQALSVAIQLRERGEVLTRTSGIESARRIADIVKVLDPLSPDERRRMIAVLSAPPLLIVAGADAAVRTPAADSGAMHAAMFATMLRRFLGADWAVDVTVTDSPPFPPPAAMWRFKAAHMHDGLPPGGGVHEFFHPALSFVARVRLHDGSVVTFDSRQAPEARDWPYRLLLSLAVLLAAVIAVSLVAVRWATRPLKTLADAAEELGANINRPPLPETGPIEVQRAAHALNTMQARLIGYLRGHTRVLAAMSHDLKTPITRLRLRAELLEDTQLRSKLTADLQEMETMVSGALDFMRGIETAEPAQPIDVDALVATIQSDARDTGGSVEVSGTAASPYSGQPLALKRCLANLVDNAVHYGGSARIVVDDRAERLEIRVQDRGPGIPDAALEQVFEPYYRLEPSRSRETGGTGLGLTIARSIAASHGGTLSLRNRAEGGLEAILTLPRLTRRSGRAEAAAPFQSRRYPRQ